MWSIAKNYSSEQRLQLLNQLAATLGDQRFCREAAKQIVQTIQPERSVPASLDRFREVFSAGVEYFLSCLSQQRLKAAINELILNDSDPEMGRSIFLLALSFPSLHKLGQVVARRPDIDPDLKAWLIRLEKGNYGTPLKHLIERVEDELSTHPEADDVTFIGETIAEGSVAATIPFRWQHKDKKNAGQGVFKVLRPQVGEKLQEELQALAEMAEFLESNRDRFGLQNLNLVELIEELGNDLRKEIDLAAEQRTLLAAEKVYRNAANVHTPAVLPYCTENLTAMEFYDAPTVGELDFAEKKASLAELICNSIICTPLFWNDDLALFHGDPHAGNILTLPSNEPDKCDIVLIDWTLAGYLSRDQRVLIMKLLLDIVKSDSEHITKVIMGLASNHNSENLVNIGELFSDLEKHVQETNKSTDDPLVRVFRLLEHAAFLGVSFPSELVLYRKAFFTLEGVLNDICPNFSMADCLEKYLQNLMLSEFPLRSAAWLIPNLDDAAYYRSLISTSDLQSLISYWAFSDWKRFTNMYTGLISASYKFAADWFSLMESRSE